MTSSQARKTALAVSSSREICWCERVNVALDRLHLSKRRRRDVDVLLFDWAMPDNLPLSNHHVRDASRLAFADTMAEAWGQDSSTPLYFVTFAGARGAATLTDPAFDMVSFQRSVDAAVRHRQLAGIFSFEFDIVRRQPASSTYPVLHHCHGVVRPLNPAAFCLADMKASLAVSAAFPGWDGAVGAHIKHIQPHWLDIFRVAVYLADPFHQLKRVQPHGSIAGRNQLRSTRDGLTAGLVLRATEIQSHLSVWDTVFGVGDYGRALRSEWRQRLLANLRRQAPHSASPVSLDVAQLWRRLRAGDASNRLYRPVRVASRSAVYRSRDV